MRGIHFLFSVAVFLLTLWINQAHSTDADILLQFYSTLSVRTPFSGWSVGNAASLCSNWDGVVCNGQNRVTTLTLAGSTRLGGDTRASGLFSNVLTQLTDLETLSVDNHFFYGTFPPEYFEMPTIKNLRISNTPLTIQFPASISTNLTTLVLNAVNLTGTLPDVFPWSTMTHLEISRTELKCPLPAGLVASWSNNNAPRFAASRNLLSATGPTVCSQALVQDSPVAVYPSIHDSFSLPPIFETWSGNTWVAFSGSSLLIVPSDPTWPLSLSTAVSIQFQPIQQSPTTQDFRGNFSAFELGSFRTFKWLDAQNTTLEANATMQNYKDEEFIMSLQMTFTPGSDNIDFAYRIFNTTQAILASSSVDIALLFGLGAQHSNVGDLMPNCTALSLSSLSCSTALASITRRLILGQSDNLIVFSESNANVSMAVALSSLAVVDGAVTYPITTADIYFQDLGFSALQQQYSRLGLTEYIPRVQAQTTQNMWIPFILTTGSFDTSLEYTFSVSASLTPVATPQSPPTSGPPPSASPTTSTAPSVVLSPSSAPTGAAAPVKAPAASPVASPPRASGASRLVASILSLSVLFIISFS